MNATSWKTKNRGKLRVTPYGDIAQAELIGKYGWKILFWRSDIVKYVNLVLVVLVAILFSGCSSETVKRTTYETLQNVKERNCRQDPATDCDKRETYDDYQRKRDGLDPVK